MSKQRIMLISLVGLLVFGLLLGGQIFYKKNWLDASMLQQSSQISGVLSAKVVEINGQQEFDVVIGHVTNFPQTTRKLEKLAGKLPIRFYDQRTVELEQLLNQMQFPLQEGIDRGNFTEMEQSIKTLAEKAGVKLDLNMDSDAIYVVLNKSNSQLVTVLERHAQGRFLSSEGN